MSLRHALLGLLSQGPASGYELTKQFELSLAHAWTAKHSQIYPELAKMTDQGWVEPGEEGARGRRAYRITDAGRAELHRWLTSAPADRVNRSELMLRVFFLWTLSPEEAATHLDRVAEQSRRALAALDGLDDQVPWDSGGSDLMGRLALEQGRRTAATMAEWASWAATQVRTGHDATSLTERMPRSTTSP